MRRLLPLTLGFVGLSLLLSPPLPVSAEEAQGVISVEQKEHLHLGNWSLTSGAGIVTQGSFKTFSSERPAGSYALIVKPPAGAEAVIEVRSGSEVKTFKGRTATGVLPAGGTLAYSIDYDFTYIGDVSVGSRPSGLAFELITPWEEIRGKTPFLKKNLPAGTYAVQYLLPKGCGAPPRFSKELLAGGRISFEFAPVCALLGTENAETPRTAQEASRTSMRAKLAQRADTRKGDSVPAALAKTGRRAVGADDPEHCHNERGDAKPLKRRD